MKSLFSYVSMCFTALFVSCTTDMEPDFPQNNQLDVGQQLSESKFVSLNEVKNVLNDVCKDTLLFHDMDRVVSRSASTPVVNQLFDNDVPLAYIVNFPNDNGFVIIGATKTYYPVLAYSEKGNFDIEAGKGTGLMDWIEDLKALTVKQLSLPDDSIAKYRLIWNKYENKKIQPKRKKSAQYNFDYARLISEFQDSMMVWHSRNGYEIIPIGDPLTGDEQRDADLWEYTHTGSIWPEYEEIWQDITIGLRITLQEYTGENHTVTTHWDQTSPYNIFFPLITGKDGKNMRAYAGCATIAMGQLMNYHRHPSKYEWDKFNGNNIDYKKLSDFLFDIATDASAEYTSDDTPITVDNAIKVLKKYGYNVSTYSDIKQGLHYPYIVCTKPKGSKKGHMWLVTGSSTYEWQYSTSIWTFTDPYKFNESWSEYNVESHSSHEINWGWGGINDGIYSYLPPNIPGQPDLKIFSVIDATPIK